MGIVKLATEEQRAAYKGIYPLHGFMKVDGRWCEVEDLRCWSREDPQWEVLAPKGFHFSEGTHTLLGWTLADLRERATGLEPCGADCEFHEE